MSAERDQPRGGQRDDAGMFASHLAECAECSADGDAIAAVERRLAAASPPAIDGAALSQRLLAAARPELARRISASYWQRFAAAVLGSLIPLPLVLALNALFVALLHTVLMAIGLPTIAAYLVVSYGALLVFVLGATYAAIPVLVERSAGPRLMPLT